MNKKRVCGEKEREKEKESVCLFLCPPAISFKILSAASRFSAFPHFKSNFFTAEISVCIHTKMFVAITSLKKQMREREREREREF